MQTRLNQGAQNNEGMLASRLASMGRNGDTMLGHLTPGEVVIPISAQTPEVKQTVFSTMESMGIPPERFIVGSGANSINPATGVQEHGLGSFLKKAAKVAIPAAMAYATGGTSAALMAGGQAALGEFGGGGAGAAGGSMGGAAAGGGNNLPPTTNAALSSLEKTRPMISKAGITPIADVSGISAPAPAPTASSDDLSTDLALQEIFKRVQQEAAGQQLTAGMEFFDTGNSKNPHTGMPEYADPYSTPKTNNEQALRDLGYQGDFGAGGGDAWLKSNPDKNTAYTAKFNSTGADNWAKPLAPAAPTPPPSETITGVYQQSGNPLFGSGTAGTKGTRVQTNTGKLYNANLDANTGQYTYTDATDLTGYSPATTKGGPYGFQVPTSTVQVGKAAPVSVGGQIPGSKPATTPATTTAATTTNTSTTTNNTAQTNAAPKETYTEPRFANEKLLRDLGYQGPFGAGGGDQWLQQNPNANAEYKYRYSQMGGNRALTPAEMQPVQAPATNDRPSWLADMEARIAQLTQQLTAPATTTTPAAPVQETISTPEPSITRTSSLTPTRSRRFNSRRYKGSLARNF